MATANPGVRLPGEFSFENYIERQFVTLHERLDQMGIDIQGLEVDEQVIAEAIPKIAATLTSLHAELTAEEGKLEEAVKDLQTKEGEVQADAAQLATVQGELATAQGELAKVQGVIERLTPVKAEAEKLVVPAPAGG